MNTTLSQQLEHKRQIQDELKNAGVSRFGLYRFTSQYIPKVIHDDEHIKGVVFGRRKESEGFFGVVEAALVATDKRVLFIDHRPGYTTMDEVSYEVVTGVNITKAGPYAGLTLFTKVANFQLSFAKPDCVERFAEYVESRRLDEAEPSLQEAPHGYQKLDDRASDFLNSHEIGVLSSIDRTGVVSGAAVYYTMYDGKPYFITKTGTRKVSGIIGNQHVAFTVFDEKKLQTVQLQGVIERELDKEIKTKVSDEIIKARHYDSGLHLPPIMWLGGDDFIVFRIIPTEVSFRDYSRP